MRWKKQFIFYGDAQSPLLAPRGVCLHGNLLAVSDTAQNRVFLWYKLQGTPNQPADIVLGQTNTTDTGRNAQGEVNATSMHYPAGIYTDGARLIVADAWNHRVLIWYQLPTRHGQPADAVVGQTSFANNMPNGSGIGVAPSADTLYWPYGVWCVQNELWIADTGNRRVLYYKNLPQYAGAPADGVVGQQDMQSRDYNPQHAIWPYAVKANANGALLITDAQYYRVMFWHKQQDALQGKSADVLLGQPDFEANGANQYGLQPAAHTLNWTYDACFTQQGLAVADTGNSRILWWNSIPNTHGMPASGLLGQPDFATHGETSLSMKTKLQNELYWPFAVHYHANQLVVADTGNHRIVFYKQLAS